MYRSDDGVPARQRSVGTTVLAIVLGLVAALGAACSSSAEDGAVADPAASTETTSSTVPQLPEDVSLPIVFVHGFAGSAQQYETQAMRFAANGYPSERIVAYDHDGAGMDIGAYADGVDQLIDETLAATGAEQVYLVGHSRGTIVSSAYLGDPTRAAKVAKYVAIDGGSCVDVVPCITPNQDALPGQAHVETATSPESFAMQYEFLVGEPPAVTDLEPHSEPVVLEGRAVNFPAIPDAPARPWRSGRSTPTPGPASAPNRTHRSS